MPTIVLCGYGNGKTYQQYICAYQARRKTTTASTAAIIESRPMQPLPLTPMFHTSDWDGFAPFGGEGGRFPTKNTDFSGRMGARNGKSYLPGDDLGRRAMQGKMDSPATYK